MASFDERNEAVLRFSSSGNCNTSWNSDSDDAASVEDDAAAETAAAAPPVELVDDMAGWATVLGDVVGCCRCSVGGFFSFFFRLRPAAGSLLLIFQVAAFGEQSSESDGRPSLLPGRVLSRTGERHQFYVLCIEDRAPEPAPLARAEDGRCSNASNSSCTVVMCFNSEVFAGEQTGAGASLISAFFGPSSTSLFQFSRLVLLLQYDYSLLIIFVSCFLAGLFPCC